MKIQEIIAESKIIMNELTGLAVETVSSIKKNGDRWVVRLDLLEMRMTPNTRDVLGLYELTLDHEGNLVGYERLGRYERQQLAVSPE